MKNKKIVTARTVITSHINADFDAVASMLAAQKLYPDSVIIFPGTQEKNLRDFFISSMRYLFNMADAHLIDFSSTRRLVLVDTRQENRVAGVSDLLKKKDIDIHIYDHHPSFKDDIRGAFERIENTGATVTILSKIIREKKIALTPDEATIMALGIYEDTGLFTYASTHEDDFNEAAFLLSCGANLNTISSLVIKEIKPEQVTWLNELLNEMVIHKVNGFDVHISTISSPDYIPDLATIVQKVIRMENIDIFFAVVLMGNKITIVARNRLPEFDVGKILSHFGGGGHYYAASAKVHDKTLVQAEQRLLQVISNAVQSHKVTKELMNSPAITIPADKNCKEASRIMTRYNINALVVTNRETAQPEGCITRQVIEKALYHNLADLPVEEYMDSEIRTVFLDSPFSEIETIIIEEKQRVLPVMDQNAIAGVITRTDLLNFLVEHNKSIEQSEKEEQTGKPKKRKNIDNLLAQRLDVETRNILTSMGETGDELGLNVYVVGGFVRDLLLNRNVCDIDIVVEGDGIWFARKHAAKAGCRINAYKKFGTAVIIFPTGYKVDIASARLEYYKTPAALPTVEMSSIKLDLFRRDFTINTLAVCLNQDNYGMIIDFFGGARDLKDKTIRTIHSLSFVEDPTRVFRAIKFANRFEFKIGKVTANLIKNAVKIDSFKNLSGLRVLSELKQIFEEENPIPAIRNMQDYGLEKVLHPELSLDQETYSLLEEVYKTLSWHDLLYIDDNYPRWSVYFMSIIKKCTYKVSEEVCHRLQLPLKEKKIVLHNRLKAQETLATIENALPLKNSTLYSKLAGFNTELILFMMASAVKEETKKAISLFFTRLRYTTVSIGGKDLIDMGLRPGPVFRDIFLYILAGRLDGKIETKAEEIQLAKNYIKAHKLVE